MFNYQIRFNILIKKVCSNILQLDIMRIVRQIKISNIFHIFIIFIWL